MEPLYFDYNATTPLDTDVLAAMIPYFTEHYGNPSSVSHTHGARAAQGLELARGEIADAIGARPEEIVFTGSCTEANNIAILGVAAALPDKQHFVTTQIEHPAVLECYRALEARGARVTYLPVDTEGLVSPDAVSAAIEETTALVSVMGANNEVGSLQPLAEIGAICNQRGVLLHSDCAQLAAYSLPNVQLDGIHLLAISAHKMYGPKGVGALYVRSRRPRVRLARINFGGGQERGLRSGTVAVPMAVGLAVAVRKAEALAATEGPRLCELHARIVSRILELHPDTEINGPRIGRLPSNLSLSIPGVEPYALIHALRTIVSFSASSACATQHVQTSYVLAAMYGAEDWRARNAFRLGLGRDTTIADAELVASAVATEAVRLRRMTNPRL
jgi:cysteine desulfurase